MSTRLQPTTPYLPVGGMVPDKNSLSLAQTECVDMLNLRALQDRVLTRGGSRRVALNVPSGDPILHMHTYKAQDGTETLFGFTKQGVYTYNLTTESWTDALDYTLIDECDTVSAANWSTTVTGSGSPILDTGNDNPYFGSNEFQLLVGNPNSVTSSDYLLSRLNLTLDLTGHAYISFWYQLGLRLSGEPLAADYSFATINLALEFYDGATLKGTTNFTLDRFYVNYTPITWKQINIEIPAGVTTITALKIKFTGSLSLAALSFFVDHVVAKKGFTDFITYWSADNFTDINQGPTVIAAGSVPPSVPVEGETDAGKRVLLYYDTNDSVFKSLVQRTIVCLVDQELGSGDGQATYTKTVHATLREGTIRITAVTGAFGTMELQDNGSGALVGDGGSGTINYTTGVVTFTFLHGVTANEKIYVDYCYYETVVHRPRIVRNFYNRLIMFNDSDGTNYYPYRVSWTQPADITLTDDADFVDRADYDTSPIMAVEPQGNYMILYRQETVEKMRYVGGTTLTFDFVPTWPKGIFAARTVATWQNVHLFLGRDDVYIFDGNIMKSIATERIREQIFRVLNTQALYSCFGFVYHRYNEYWLWITRSGETYPTAAYVYSIAYDKWYYFEFSPTTCMGEFQLSSGVAIDDLVGTIAEQHWFLDSAILEGAARTVLMALQAGDVYAVDERLCSDYGYDTAGTWTPGSAIPIRLITKDWIGSDLARLDRYERFVFEANGREVDVSYSYEYETDPSAFKYEQNITLPAQPSRSYYFPDIVAEHLRLCFQSSEQQAFMLRWVQAFVVVKEKD